MNKGEENLPILQDMTKGKRKGKKQVGEEGKQVKFLTPLIRGRAKTKWSETVGLYSMGFKVQTNSEQIGVPLKKYGNNCEILPNWPLSIKGEKEIRLLLEGKRM